MAINEASFWSKVEPLMDDQGCWIWAGDIAGPMKYGLMTERRGTEPRKRIYAHRYSWVLHFGPIPAGLFVLHRCDVPRCVNPAHLFVGTSGDNQRDSIQKNRGRWRNHSRTTRVWCERHGRNHHSLSVLANCQAGRYRQQDVSSRRRRPDGTFLARLS